MECSKMTLSMYGHPFCCLMSGHVFVGKPAGQTGQQCKQNEETGTTQLPPVTRRGEGICAMFAENGLRELRP